ncbi:hypothetical protein CPB83DRAFT_889977 [Crepidotus variabilis]|uniref:M-phase inducer phosphatase n=1 Tax=Crepidotus variabilis TaxID=179855 RepID=A0A9P6ER12_9AGAR|nr:hypothetical protein CPB83DRAFT_889977 [Crepidotus variabilis]
MCIATTRPPSNSVYQPFSMNHHRPGPSNHRKRPSDSDITPTFRPSLPPPVLHRLTDTSSRNSYHKRQKRSLPDNMAFFSTTTATRNLNDSGAFLAAPSRLSRKKSSHKLFLNGDIDLSSDLEISFASNVSLNSPPREQVSLPSDAMDISPVPVSKPTSSRFNLLDIASRPSRPRAFTSGPRLFGQDISNNGGLMPSPQLNPTSSAASVKGSIRSNAKKIARSALPFEWMATPEPTPEPSSPADDAMDVDVSYYNNDPAPAPVTAQVAPLAPSPLAFSPIPHSAAPTVTEFNNMFYNSLSPRRSFDSPSARIPKKPRRSLSPESARKTKLQREEESSPALPLSPSDAKLDRMAAKATSSKPGLQGLGAPSASFLKRPRRPVLSAMVQPGDHMNSAYPILSPLDSASSQEDGQRKSASNPRGAVQPRRAFSALLPPGSYLVPEHDEAESSFDAEGPDMSSPAQAYSKRQQVKTIRRCDGTEDFRPLTGVTALAMKESSPSSKLMAAQGLPGFGDNEKHGKILPCHRVTEDGLMRVKPDTVNELLDGRYDNQIVAYQIIDCRFDYEYNGGHIPGAVNINSTSGVEQLLLGSSLAKPRPSVSGDSAKKTILIFHCEFSAKRAPTFAKHLRAKDRAANHHAYPKIHYPEVYILEGGYCQYFKESGSRCDPPAYVQMDDPNHATARQQDLDQFRKAKFGRHKSYAYGDGKSLPFGQQVQPQVKRNTVPAGPPSMFTAAGNVARSRRSGSGSSSAAGGLVVANPLERASSLMTLMEDHGNTTQEADDTDVETDIGDSPCPPPTKATMLKGKGGMKMPLPRQMVRSETYGPSRMSYGM